MHWIVIALLFAQTFALVVLVLTEGWTVLQASLTVIGFVVCFAVTVIAGALLFTPLQFREEFLQVVRNTIRDDLRDIARWIRMR